MRKTIKSIVNQTYKDFEFIIIDGASSDSSLDVINEYSNCIDYWISEPDMGIYNAMNKGIDIARGEYCIFINSGDCLYNNETLSAVSIELDGTNIITGTTMFENGEQWFPPNSLSIPYFYTSSLSHPASFIKMSLLKKYHYDESLKIVSDWKFFLQILLIEGVSYKPLNIIISIFDISGISMNNPDLCMKERQNVLDNDFKYLKQYIIDNAESYDAQLYNLIRASEYRKCFYTLIIMLIKFFDSFNNKKRFSKFPLTLN